MAGYLAARKLREGSSGTPVLLQTLEYATHTVGGITVHPIASETVYRNDNGTDAITTTYASTYHSGTNQPAQQTTTLPVVPTTQNGTNVAAMRQTFSDLYGRVTWERDERGTITHRIYDLVTGALVRQIDDVDTSLYLDVPSGWTTPTGGGLNLVTDYQADDLGRTTQVLGPVHQIDLSGTPTNIRTAQWTVYDDVNHITYHAGGFAVPATSDFQLINPVSITQRDASGKILEQIQAVAPDTDGTLAEIIDNAGGGAAAFPQTSYTRWTTSQYTDCCLAASMRVYHTIPSSGAGSSGTNYDQTTYGYDVMKRRNRTVTPGGTITFQVYNVRGQVIATYVGTDDSGATEQDPTGGGLDPNNNMVLVTALEYDNGQDEGDGNLTQQTQHVDATTTRVTTFEYDWRNRRTTTDGELDFYQVDTYDNLSHVIQTDRYDTDDQGHLIARSQTQYDNRGRVYQTVQFAVDPNTGTIGDSLADSVWYDASRHVIKRQPSGLMTSFEMEYDSLGRLVKEIDPLNAETAYAYDAASNRITLTDAEGNTTTWSYDGINHVVAETN